MICSQNKYLFPVFAIAIAIGAAGCTNNGNNSNLGTTGPTPTIVTEMHSGSIMQGTTDIYSFTITNSGLNLLVGFTSISPNTIPALGVGIGAWDPTSSTCGLNQLQATAGVGATAITTPRVPHQDRSASASPTGATSGRHDRNLYGRSAALLIIRGASPSNSPTRSRARFAGALRALGSLRSFALQGLPPTAPSLARARRLASVLAHAFARTGSPLRLTRFEVLLHGCSTVTV